MEVPDPKHGHESVADGELAPVPLMGIVDPRGSLPVK